MEVIKSSLGYGRPPRIFKGCALYQIHLVEAQTARAFIPKELKIVEAFGYTVGGFFLASYDESPVGAFDEKRIIAKAKQTKDRSKGFRNMIRRDASLFAQVDQMDIQVTERSDSSASDLISIRFITPTFVPELNFSRMMSPAIKISLPNFRELFPSFGGLGSQKSWMSRLFGGRDPFDDPFFTRPFRTVSPSPTFSGPGRSNDHMGSKSLSSDMPRGPIIREFFSDDEEDGLDSKMSTDEPSVEHPDDESGREDEMTRRNDMDCRSDDKNDERRQSTGPTFSFRKVTHGGVNGPYRSSSVTRTTGNDGVVIEESTAADKTTGEAAHRFSRGIHDKIHSVTRTLNPDGKVETKQTLHNLNEDELAGFEENWADRNFANWRDRLNLHNNIGAGDIDAQDTRSILRARAVPSFTPYGEARAESGIRASQSTSGRAKNVVRIPVE